VKQILKDKLPRLELEQLGKLDRGAVARRFSDAIEQVLANISKFPFRDGNKVETRSISMSVYLTPELKLSKQGVEGRNGRQHEVDVAELSGVSVRVKIKSALPDAETADVRMACDIQNGRITDLRFNPENNAAPEQLELELADDELDPADRLAAV
jgi:hypothetical protein